MLVWDIPTRLFHWLTAALVLAAYVTARLELLSWHLRAGGFALCLVLFRIVWGIAGSETSRFGFFLRPPAAAARHLAGLFRRDPDEQLGHNPAGGWMVVLLIALLFGETLSGVLLNNDVSNDGPLTQSLPAPVLNAITDAHVLLWDALAAAIVLHLAAVAVYSLVKQHRLVRPMITGSKRLALDRPPPGIAPPIRALGIFLCCAAATAAMMILL